jgi:DNA (cytosine-5)-methyltransferase 1
VSELVLSVFPGIDLLGLAFEQEGFTVVRGPDPIWGGDVKTFHPPAGRFDGIIGGPPCQIHSRLRFLNPLAGQKHGDLIPEFCRVVAEAQPEWFLMENVPEAPLPVVEGYVVRALILNNRWLGADQQRERRFSFGTRDGRALDVSPDVAVFESPLEALAVTASLREAVPVRMQRAPGGGHVLKKRLRPPTVVAGHGNPPAQRDSGLGGTRSLAEMCRLQGLPEDFADELPFTTHGKRKVIGNGVPLTTGRPIARAVKRAMAKEIAA